MLLHPIIFLKENWFSFHYDVASQPFPYYFTFLVWQINCESLCEPATKPLLVIDDVISTHLVCYINVVIPGQPFSVNSSFGQ